MRTITILAVMAITATFFVYNFKQDNPADGKSHPLDFNNIAYSSLEPQNNLEKLSGVVQGYQKIIQEQFQQTQLQQAKLNKTLTVLDTRIRSLEIAVGEQTADRSVPTSSELAEDEEAWNSDSRNPDIRKVSEADMGRWIDESLGGGSWNQDTTKQAVSETEKSLEKVPGVNLEDMQCSDRFCRATFSHEDGKDEAILDLLGSPPFVNEIFTISGTDGHVLLYAAQPGQSLEEFRSEVQEIGFEH